MGLCEGTPAGYGIYVYAYTYMAYGSNICHMPYAIWQQHAVGWTCVWASNMRWVGPVCGPAAWGGLVGWVWKAKAAAQFVMCEVQQHQVV